MSTVSPTNLFGGNGAPDLRLVNPPDRDPGFALRPYQVEDANAVTALWHEHGYRAPVVRSATGSGKAVLIAEMARRMSQRGRVMVVVDVTTLADDLARTIHQHTGAMPGLLTGSVKMGLGRTVVVATIQSLYSGEDGDRTYERWDPGQFAALLVDECEASIAERFSETVRHFMGNPSLKVMGCSATPFRGDGQGMGAIYDYAADEAGPLNRDILWCRDNGWLVNLKQGFVHTNVDFSSLKVRRDSSGDKDYSDAELAKLLEEEADLRQLAHSIYDASQGEPAIVICPNSTDLCDKLAGHLEAIDSGCARSVHGKQGKHAEFLMERYQAGDYPIIVSVKKLEKGFDSDRPRHCFATRKTKSRRLYEQWSGRIVRPLTGIRPALAEAESAEERCRIIAESDKPHAVMWDLVGVNEKAKDLLGVVDILNGSASEGARQRAKQRMLEADEGEAQDTDEAAREGEAEEERERQRQADLEERRKRSLVQTTAKTETEITDNLRAIGGGYARSDVPTRQLDILRKGKWPEHVIKRMTPEQVKEASQKQWYRFKRGLCTYKQAKMLQRHGYSRGQLREMSKKEASRIIDGIMGNK